MIKILKAMFSILIFSLVLISCSESKVSNTDIDEFIKTYQSTNFNVFQNYTIAIRQRNVFETIYLLNDGESVVKNVICFVYVNRITNKIEKIKFKKKTNLKNEKIRSLIYKFREYNFAYLSVDKDINISVNPFTIDLEPYLFFVKKNELKSQVEKNFTVFKHYKGNWYVKG